jgi:hypothetical protein
MNDEVARPNNVQHRATLHWLAFMFLWLCDRDYKGCSTTAQQDATVGFENIYMKISRTVI